MIPYILAVVGGYFIGDSLKGKQFAEGNYSDGGRISKGVKWKQEWTDTIGVEGYDILEIEDTKYFSNNYGRGIVVRSRIIESSKPERVGNYQEDSKTELRKIFSGKYPFAYKYAEGGMMAKDGLKLLQMKNKVIYESKSHTRDTSHEVLVIQEPKVNGVKLKMTYESYNANEKFTGVLFVGGKWEHFFSLRDLGMIPDMSMYVRDESVREKKSKQLQELGINFFNLMMN